MRRRIGIETQAFRCVERRAGRRWCRLVLSACDSSAEQYGSNGHQCREQLPHRKLGESYAWSKRRALRFFPHTHNVDVSPLFGAVRDLRYSRRPRSPAPGDVSICLEVRSGLQAGSAGPIAAVEARPVAASASARQ